MPTYQGLEDDYVIGGALPFPVAGTPPPPNPAYAQSQQSSPFPPPAPVTWYERILNPDPETIHLHVMFTLPGIFAGWFIAKKLKGK